MQPSTRIRRQNPLRFFRAFHLSYLLTSDRAAVYFLVLPEPLPPTISTFLLRAVLGSLGRLSIVSFYERELDGIMLDPLVLGCNSIVGAAGCYGNAPAVCEIMRKNPIKLTPIITHRFHYTEFDKGFEAMNSGKSGKVVLDWTKK